MSLWPSISCTARRSAPPSSRWVAKQWRKVCGLTHAARIGGGPSFERLEKSLPGHRAAEPRNENRRDAPRDFFPAAPAVVGRIQNFIAPLEVGLQRANRGTTHRHHPLLTALPSTITAPAARFT